MEEKKAKNIWNAVENWANVSQILQWIAPIIPFSISLLSVLIGNKTNKAMPDTITSVAILLPYLKGIVWIIIGIIFFMFFRSQSKEKEQDKIILLLAKAHKKLKDDVALTVFSTEYKVWTIMEDEHQGFGTHSHNYSVDKDKEYTEKKLRNFYGNYTNDEIEKLVNNFFSIDEHNKTKS